MKGIIAKTLPNGWMSSLGAGYYYYLGRPKFISRCKGWKLVRRRLLGGGSHAEPVNLKVKLDKQVKINPNFYLLQSDTKRFQIKSHVTGT